MEVECRSHWGTTPWIPLRAWLDTMYWANPWRGASALVPVIKRDSWCNPEPWILLWTWVATLLGRHLLRSISKTSQINLSPRKSHDEDRWWFLDHYRNSSSHRALVNSDEFISRFDLGILAGGLGGDSSLDLAPAHKHADRTDSLNDAWTRFNPGVDLPAA